MSYVRLGHWTLPVETFQSSNLQNTAKPVKLKFVKVAQASSRKVIQYRVSNFSETGGALSQNKQVNLKYVIHVFMMDLWLEECLTISSSSY